MPKKKKKPNRRPFNLETHWKTNFEYPFLGSHDFPILSPSGRDLILTIKEFYQEEVTNKDGNSWCNVIKFYENTKPMICNKINFGNLQVAYGCTSGKGFLGKKVFLYVEKGVWSFGSKVNALRFRDFAPEAGLEPLLDSEIKKAANHLFKHGDLDAYEAVRNISKKQKAAISKLVKDHKVNEKAKN